LNGGLVMEGKEYSILTAEISKATFGMTPSEYKNHKNLKGEMPDTSGKLTWSHYVEILGVSNDLARSFYEKQCILENWSVRELKRQKQSMLFERFSFGE
jgi:hypothetical protein